MEMQPNARGLGRKELIAATGCPPYLIDYYRDCGYLPILRPSTGSGDPVLYHPDAVEVIRQRRGKRLGHSADDRK